MGYRLTYEIGNKVVEEWTFHSKSLAYWMKSELLWSGRYENGKFKIKKL